MTLNKETSDFYFDNSFAHHLEDFFAPSRSDSLLEPKLLKFNYSLAKELGLDLKALDSEEGLAIFSGNKIPKGAEPLAQAYSGHQFGGFSPLLGDGRALLLGEIIDTQGQRHDVQLKGSGPSPFSRGGDGKSALGPVLREYLISESMHALGIPTTRSLAAVATGENVYRETALPGGILTRIASSHIRVGTFQFGTALGDIEKIRRLTDYCINRHYPRAIDSKNCYLTFFEDVCNAQAKLISRWMSVGFIHGVMNTDNMTISGETIDYGPCAFMDMYSPDTVFSSIDEKGRYAYANQPNILTWNLTRLAETLVPLVDLNQDRAVELLTVTIQNIEPIYQKYWLAEMRSKIGLSIEDPSDLELIKDLLSIMEKEGADFTLVFRRLSKALEDKDHLLLELFKDPSDLNPWLLRWKGRLEQEENTKEVLVEIMNTVNPIYIPRNHTVEEVLTAATQQGDIKPFSDFLLVLEKPFDEINGNETYAIPGPVPDQPYQTFCGT